MPAQLPALGQAAAEVLGDDRRLERAEAYAHVPGVLRADEYDVGKAGLSGQIDPVGRDLYAGEDYLAVALGGYAAHLLGGVLKGQTAQPSARVRNYAVGAEIDAPVLYLEHGPRAAVDRPGGQTLEAAAFERLVVAHCALPG